MFATEKCSGYVRVICLHKFLTRYSISKKFLQTTHSQCVLRNITIKHVTVWLRCPKTTCCEMRNCSNNISFSILSTKCTKKYPNMKITISQKCANIFQENFAHLFTRELRKSVLFCAVFTWHTPNWWSANFKTEFCNCTDCTKGWFHY